MPEHILRGIVGVAALILIATLCSCSRKDIRWKPIGTALAFNLLFAFLVLHTPFGKAAFGLLSSGLLKIMKFADEGIKFVFGPLFGGFSAIPGFQGSSYVFVLQALMQIVFFAVLINLLYYLQIMQRVVRGMAWLFRMLFGLTGPEATVASSNIFVGQVQGAMTVAPYIKNLTESQLFQIMVVGMSTVGAGMPIIYASMGAKIEYVLAANIMAAPAAMVFAKLLVPEQEDSVRDEAVVHTDYQAGINLLDAAGKGAMDGYKVVVAISVMLLGFIPLIHLLNWLIVSLSSNHSDLETILSWLFAPAAYIVGVPSTDVMGFAKLLGQKIAFNEVIGFGGLKDTALSPKGFMLTCFALTGFANFTSVGIQIGGIGELAPTRRSDVARLGLRCVLAATLANLLNAAIAGMLFGG
ncbi:concentrative nucleoside transporter, CNT family [Trichlorobacter thiogenes]|uniref:Concentrative nucleoside transporter, CNT family n=1 Tax=Trichlorobacter thiogenes TaxID=115783 RepID=A0A1T4PI72_9BACT|nr:nucleoside transporter C-terminal domain-containing protein [Trichlorobacter thiogenes]SJZ91199.1 concentrative nucleoside transporter, CNT family [Trichlorobacter thiogenes]